MGDERWSTRRPDSAGPYGIGTGLPVFAFALLIALGARSLARAFGRISEVERWARRITGVVFLGVGIYYTLAYVFEVV